MNKDLEKIKMILRDLPSCSEAQYKRLVEVYGIDLVTVAKGELLSEYEEQSNEMDTNSFSANEYYARDVKRLDKQLGNKKNNQLVLVCSILEELNGLLNQQDDMIFN